VASRCNLGTQCSSQFSSTAAVGVFCTGTELVRPGCRYVSPAVIMWENRFTQESMCFDCLHHSGGASASLAWPGLLQCLPLSLQPLVMHRYWWYPCLGAHLVNTTMCVRAGCASGVSLMLSVIEALCCSFGHHQTNDQRSVFYPAGRSDQREVACVWASKRFQQLLQRIWQHSHIAACTLCEAVCLEHRPKVFGDEAAACHGWAVPFCAPQ
jgi:hypothetical protein